MLLNSRTEKEIVILYYICESDQPMTATGIAAKMLKYNKEIYSKSLTAFNYMLQILIDEGLVDKCDKKYRPTSKGKKVHDVLWPAYLQLIEIDNTSNNDVVDNDVDDDDDFSDL